MPVLIVVQALVVDVVLHRPYPLIRLKNLMTRGCALSATFFKDVAATIYFLLAFAPWYSITSLKSKKHYMLCWQTVRDLYLLGRPLVAIDGLRSLLGVVSAPLWNGDTSRFAGMFTVSDIIHLIQYYYLHSSYDNAAHDVEHFRLESIRGMLPSSFLYSLL